MPKSIADAVATIAAETFSKRSGVVAEILCVVRGARDRAIREMALDEFRGNFGIHVDQHHSAISPCKLCEVTT